MASNNNIYIVDEKTAAKRAELLSLLTSMGYKAVYAQRAIEKVDVHLKNAAELCFHWMEENPEEELVAHMTEEERKLENAMEPIVNMGFTREQAVQALKANDNDISKAIMWILGEQANNLKRAIGDEQAALGRDNTTEPLETSDPYEQKRPSEGHGKQVQDAINADKGNLKSQQEVDALTKQILELQDLVLTYQNKYVELKRETRKLQRGKHSDNIDDV